jgi:hypothetical protein
MAHTPKYSHEGSHERHTNSRANDVVRACLKPLKARLHLGGRINCGAQGCVYKSGRDRIVVKVSVDKSKKYDWATQEAKAAAWRHKLGRHAPPSMPTVRQVYRLGECAKTVTKLPAYVTVRENLANVPENSWTRKAVKMLKELEKALGKPGQGRHAARIVLEHTRKHHDVLRLMHRRNQLAYTMWTQISHVQAWLAVHGMTLFDMKLSNLGIRKPGKHGPFDVVVRDMGLLDARSNASKRQEAAFDNAHKRAKPLGALDVVGDSLASDYYPEP